MLDLLIGGSMRRFIAMVVVATSFTGCQLPMTGMPVASQQSGYQYVAVPVQLPSPSQNASAASSLSHEQSLPAVAPVAATASTVTDPYPGYRIAYIPIGTRQNDVPNERFQNIVPMG